VRANSGLYRAAVNVNEVVFLTRAPSRIGILAQNTAWISVFDFQAVFLE